MSRQVKIGDVLIGGGALISVQSMTNTDTKDVDKTVAQIKQLEESGCEIVRVAVPDMESANALKEIKERINIPLVADIHFDYKIALEAAKYVDKLRINPGNIGSADKIKEVVDAAKEHNIPIRIGVNLGSLENDIEKEHGLSAKAMVLSAERNIKLLEEQGFYDIVVSLKGSDVVKTIEANKMFAERFDYPVHLGVTESGARSGIVKSSVGVGALLASGIGDTIRVSLSADPVEEVKVAWDILKSLQLRKRGVDVVSCPTCARANIDVIAVAKDIEDRYKTEKKPLKVAIMGCGVNGPGEAKEADVGVVGGSDKCLLYCNGEIIKRLSKDEVADSLKEEIDKVVL